MMNEKMRTPASKTLSNTEVLDDIYNEATERIEGLPGIREAYMRKAVNLSLHENYLVLYDGDGRIIGRMVIRNDVVIRVESYRDDVRAILESYIGASITVRRSNRNDMHRGGRPCCDCWL